jgi:hypothetical protein
VSLSIEHGFSWCLAYGLIYQGWSMTSFGDLEEGYGLIAKGPALQRTTGAVAYRAFALIVMAQACDKLGRTTEGLNYLTEAEQIIATADDRHHAAGLHHVRGDLLNATGDQVAAERSYHQALSVARRQSARTLELRAAASLARVATRVRGSKPIIYSRLFTAGSPKASTRRSCKTQRRCSTSWRDAIHFLPGGTVPQMPVEYLSGT